MCGALFHQAVLESANSLFPIGITQLRQLVEGPPRPGRPAADSAFDQHGNVMGPSRLLAEAFRRAFFDLLQTALVSGVGQVKLASGLAPGKEILVVFNDKLRPIFQKVTYV